MVAMPSPFITHSMPGMGLCAIILPMNTLEIYIERALTMLEKWLPRSKEELQKHYKEHPEDCDGMWKDDFYYCLFSWKEKQAERIILLVYDNDIVIADLSAMHCPIDTLMHDVTFYDAMSFESDWMYLEHYILSSLLFPKRAYPDFSSPIQNCEGEALLFSNAYVTRTYRNRKIFTNMESMTRSFALRKTTGLSRLASIFSLDPDVACYGPDTQDEPYIYCYEKDEPVRGMNAKIAEKIGYEPLKLEETEHHEEDDGTKLWFAVHMEKTIIL